MQFTKLEKGKLLDAQPGFVDSWNRMVDCWNNLAGVNDASVKWRDDFHPTVDVQFPPEDDGDESSDDDYDPEDDFPEFVLPPFDPIAPAAKSLTGRFSITSVTTDEGETTIVFANRYYDVGGKTYECSSSSVTIGAAGFVALRVGARQSNTASLAYYATLADLQYAQGDYDYFTAPLYQVDENGVVVCDLRVGPSISMGEF